MNEAMHPEDPGCPECGRHGSHHHKACSIGKDVKIALLEEEISTIRSKVKSGITSLAYAAPEMQEFFMKEILSAVEVEA